MSSSHRVIFFMTVDKSIARHFFADCLYNQPWKKREMTSSILTSEDMEVVSHAGILRVLYFPVKHLCLYNKRKYKDADV